MAAICAMPNDIRAWGVYRDEKLECKHPIGISCVASAISRR
jgi:hypothetical protein